MCQWTLFEVVVTRELCQDFDLNIDPKHRHHLYDFDSAQVKSSGKTLAKVSRWLGKVLVTSGERLLRHAG